jgi:hypothetical protein
MGLQALYHLNFREVLLSKCLILIGKLFFNVKMTYSALYA